MTGAASHDTMPHCSGLSEEWLDDHTIRVFTFHNNRRETIDTWAEAVHDIVRTWPTDKPYFILYDASQIFLTPYLRERSQAIGRIKRPGLHGYYAVVMPSSVTGKVLSSYLENEMERGYQATFDFFSTREEGLEWLRAQRGIGLLIHPAVTEYWAAV